MKLLMVLNDPPYGSEGGSEGSVCSDSLQIRPAGPRHQSRETL